MDEDLLATLAQFGINKPTSPYQRLLTRLWSMEWVDKNELTAANNGQTDTPRRIRELDKEFGFDIERNGKSGDESAYRLKSRRSRLERPRRRPYFTPIQKEGLKKRDPPLCKICGRFSPDDYGMLQIDHRIPFDKGGETTLDNAQFLCTTCNVYKRRRCELCTVPECSDCAYAYPEKYDGVVVLHLHEQLIVKCKSAAEKNKISIEDVIIRAIEHFND